MPEPRRIFVAGASGVIGRRLTPLLVAAGHTVAGLTRSAAKTDLLRSLGAEPVVADAFDRATLTDALVAFAPDTVVHQLTDLPDSLGEVRARAVDNARMRREGTGNLVAAAQAAAARHFLAQSVAWTVSGDPDSAAAVRDLESAVLAIGGTVLRYGQFYGPGTYNETTLPPHPRVHVDDAARRTVAALDQRGVVTIAD